MREPQHGTMPLKRRALCIAGAAALSLSMIGTVGCSSNAGSASSAADEANEELVRAMEYADGGDQYDHESIEVTDEHLVAEGAQFVNGVGEENTYIYKGYAHGDNAHYSMYSLYTELITDEDGLLTGVNLTSGDDTWSNKWGDLGANPEITGTLPEGVSFSYTEENGVITPELTVEPDTEAEKAGWSLSAIYLYNVQDDLTTVGTDVAGRRGSTHMEYDASVTLDAAIVDDDDDDEEEAAQGQKGGNRSGGDASADQSQQGEHGNRGGGEGADTQGGERGGRGGEGSEGGQGGGKPADGAANAESADTAAPAEPVGYSYDEATGAITIEGGSYNLVQLQYKFGTEVLFNEFIAVDGNENATAYVEKNFPDTSLEAIEVVDGTGVTNRTKWTYSMLSLMAQREFASWGSTFEDESLYTGGNDGEIGDIDTISGATKTSIPFQSALNQAIEAGYVTGVSDEVEVTIDGGADATDGIDATETPQDQTVVTVNDAGQYVITFDFPAGVDETAHGDGSTMHAIAPNSIEVYALDGEELGTLGVWNLGKGTAGYEAVATYADSSREPGDVDDATVTYVSDWEYPYQPSLTIKDPSITHVVIYYTIGHENLGIAYDLKAMAEAHEVEEAIEALNVDDAAAVSNVLAQYEALNNDVIGTVKNANKLLDAAQ